MVKWNWRKSRIIFPRESEHLVLSTSFFVFQKNYYQSIFKCISINFYSICILYLPVLLGNILYLYLITLSPLYFVFVLKYIWRVLFPSLLLLNETYVQQFSTSDQIWLLISGHFLSFCSFVGYISGKLAPLLNSVNVSNDALNHF